MAVRPSAPLTSSWLSLLLITLLAAPVWQPLTQASLTCGFDNVFHLWRAVQMGELLSQGVWFSRWAPHMAHGYGYPLYLFQSPFSAYLVALLQAAGLAWPVALNAVYGLAVVASGWTMWRLAHDVWGDWGAMVAAMAFVYAPFHAYVLFYRASLSEAVAWALLPLVLWGVRRWQIGSERQGVVTAVLAFITLVFTHDVTAYAFLPFMVGWVVVLARGQQSWRCLGRGALALALGLSGSAFFWLPAILERQAIQFDRANSAWPFLYFNNFLPIDQLLALPRNADPALLNDWPERGLGLLLTGLALTGALAAWRRRPGQRWLLVYLVAALAGYIWLTVAASRPLWDAVPVLQAFQFPWRFLAPATFIAALLTGGLFPVTGQRSVVSGRRWVVSREALTDYGWPLAAIAIFSVAHWGWLYPRPCPAPTDVSLAGLVAWEEATGTLGTTASRELLPVTVQQMPEEPTDSPVWLSRLSPADLPEGAAILDADYTPLRAEVTLETAVPFTARFHSFYFPGWRAWIDGEAVDITPSEPSGLITFFVPAGRHALVVAFGETPLRWLTNAFSLLSLIVLAWVVWRAPSSSAAVRPARQPGPRWWLALLIVGLALGTGKWLLVDRGGTFPRRSNLADGHLAGVMVPANLTFGDPAHPAQIRLLGYDAWATAVPADRPLVVSLYWQALTPLAQEMRVGLTLIDDRGIRWSEEGLRDYRWTRGAPPTTAWPVDQYVQTAFLVDLRHGTPPGTYALQLSLFDHESLLPLTAYQDGQLVGPAMPLGQIDVRAPQKPFTAPTHPPQFPAERTGGITVYSVQADRATAAPGDTLLFTLMAEPPATAAADLTLSLLDPPGQVTASWPLELSAHGRGVWRYQLLVTLPASLTDGRYGWQLTFPNGQTAALGELYVDAPERLFAPPPVDTAVDTALFQDGQPIATLVGYSWAQGVCQRVPGTCPLSLVWRVEQETTQALRVFVQVWDMAGTLVAQSDGVAAQWTRPSTGWQAGEYIMDDHYLRLDGRLPPGTYRLVMGLYHPDHGRLLTLSGADYIEAGQVTVPP